MPNVGAHGEGGITKREDGRLTVRITMPGGNRLTRTIPAMKDGRAQRRLAEAQLRELREARAADLEPETQTLEAYLRSWLRSLGETRRVRPRTIEFYSMIVEQRIIPTLGGHRLHRLSERHVQAWLDGEPGSPQTIHHCRAVLRRALNVAVRQRILARNAAIAVELPEVDEFVGDPLTVAEARQLLEATAADRLGPLWRFALVTGLRQAELLGLAWDDVDLKAGRITVRAQLARRDGKWIRIEGTKTGRRLHSVSIDPATVAVLRAHQVRQADERRPTWLFWGLVFVTVSGMPWERSAILRAWHAACDAAGVSRRRFHDLRVSSATILEELGVEEAIRMARLGHVTKQMARHYAVARDELDREASSKLAAAIS
jgi:integrase